jgi:flavin reductase (DIM6/NTAB) family NADH-FMN oxidoreductase RutF
VAADLKHDALRNTVGKALGRIPSGVFVLTARDAERRLGMLVSWVQQAAFDPPAVSIAVGNGRPILEMILKTRRAAMSVIGERETELMRRFARVRTDSTDPFEGLDLFPAPSGIPVLAGALAWLDCELAETVDFGADHTLLLARVSAGDVLRQGSSFTHVRGNGFHY